jgi:hypothetical protein
MKILRSQHPCHAMQREGNHHVRYYKFYLHTIQVFQHWQMPSLKATQTYIRAHNDLGGESMRKILQKKSNFSRTMLVLVRITCDTHNLTKN